MLNPYIKKVAIVSGILGCIQSTAWCILCIIQFSYYSGTILPPSYPENPPYKTILSNTIYDIFIRKDAGTLEYNNVRDIYINGKVTLSLAIGYFIFSIFWLCLSACLVKIAFGHNLHRNGWLLISWSFLTFVISILDVVATGILISDYQSVVKNAFDCLHCVVYPTALIIGISIACRGVVVWFLNISLAAFLLSLLHASIKEFGDPEYKGQSWYKRLGFFRFKIPRPRLATFMHKIRNPNDWWIFENSDTSGSSTNTNTGPRRRS